MTMEPDQPLEEADTLLADRIDALKKDLGL